MKNLERFNTNQLPPVLYVFLYVSPWGYDSVVLNIFQSPLKLGMAM